MGEGGEEKVENKNFLIKINEKEFLGEFTTENPATVDAIIQDLPITGTINRWGQEIYFYIDTQVDLENGREVVEVGEVGYWPDGPAFCIFWGPTPASRGDEIRAASAVNVLGRLIDFDTEELDKTTNGNPIQVSPAK